VNDSRPISGHVGEATSVLVLAPAFGEGDECACVDLLTDTRREGSNVLSVTFSAAPEELLLRTERTDDAPRERTAVLDARDRPADAGGDAVEDRAGVTVERLPSTADPIGVALAVGRRLGAWAEAPEPGVACLHSLTALLESVDERKAIRLVDALNRCFKSTGILGHYHMDPTAHEERVLAAFRPRFGAVAEHHPDDGWTVTAGDGPLPAGEGDAGTAPTSFPRSFDAVVELLSSPQRRRALSVLLERPDEPVSLEALAAAVARRDADDGDGAMTPGPVAATLWHSHLPKLAEFGVVSIDADERTVRYHSNPALEAYLEQARKRET